MIIWDDIIKLIDEVRDFEPIQNNIYKKIYENDIHGLNRKIKDFIYFFNTTESYQYKKEYMIAYTVEFMGQCILEYFNIIEFFGSDYQYNNKLLPGSRLDY